MKIGSTLNLIIEEPTTKKVLEYRSKIIEKSDKYIFIDYPINNETKKSGFFPVGTRFTAYYLDNDQQLYKFHSSIIKRIHIKVPALAISLPSDDSIVSMQRREYVRVYAAVDVAIHCPNETFNPFTTVTVDISGGGLSIVIPNGITVEENKKVLAWIILPMKSGENKYLKIDAKIVRSQNKENQIKTASLKFISISNKNEQDIMKFCFEKQREERIKTMGHRKEHRIV